MELNDKIVIYRTADGQTSIDVKLEDETVWLSANQMANLFENEGECISENSFEVFQVLDSGDALANEIEEKYSTSLHTGLVVLFLHENGKSYYDDQIIKIPSGKCVKQIGVYKYPTKDGFEKTVPIVDIRKK